MITCSTTPSLHNSQAIIFAQLSRSAFLTILEPGTGYIQSHTDFLYSLVCTVRYRNGLDARCILSASAIVLFGFIQLCGRFISHLSRGHNEVQNENWRLPSQCVEHDINLTVSIEDYVNLLVTLYHEKHNLWHKSLVGSEVIKSAYHLHRKFVKIFRKKIRSCFSLS